MTDQIRAALIWAMPYFTSVATTLGIIYAMLQTGLGSRIFDSTFKHYFDRKLSDLKHDQDRKLADIKYIYERRVEELRSELSQATDRGIRSNEREYQALIASWESFINAHYKTLSCIASLTFRVDLNSFSTEELTEYLEGNLANPSDRRYVSQAQDKNFAFGRIEQIKSQNEAHMAIWDARNTLRRQSVFIPKEIDERFENALSTLNKAWAEQHVNLRTRISTTEPVFCAGFPSAHGRRSLAG